jgi:hypothetical protein
MMEYTPVGLCKSILRNMARLPNEVQVELKTVYARTWGIVELWNDLLVTPRGYAFSRLSELRDVVLKELDKAKESKGEGNG